MFLKYIFFRFAQDREVKNYSGYFVKYRGLEKYCSITIKDNTERERRMSTHLMWGLMTANEKEIS